MVSLCQDGVCVIKAPITWHRLLAHSMQTSGKAGFYFFSIYAFKDILPPEHLDYRRKIVLVDSCALETSPWEMSSSDLLLFDFCKTFKQRYGEKSVTPNMHLNGHLFDRLFCLILVQFTHFWLFRCWKRKWYP